MNKLNGWQRIFIVLAVAGAAALYSICKLPPVDIEKISVSNYLPNLPELPCIPKNQSDCDSVAKLIRGDGMTDFVVDGHTIFQDKRYTQEQVEKAVRQSQADLIKEHNEKQWRIYKEVYANYFLFFVGLYVFGWAMGWVRRGFKK
jgi:hypothetical protein